MLASRASSAAFHRPPPLALPRTGTHLSRIKTSPRAEVWMLRIHPGCASPPLCGFQAAQVALHKMEATPLCSEISCDDFTDFCCVAKKSQQICANRGRSPILSIPGNGAVNAKTPVVKSMTELVRVEQHCQVDWNTIAATCHNMVPDPIPGGRIVARPRSQNLGKPLRPRNNRFTRTRMKARGSYRAERGGCYGEGTCVH